jgi:hypothetical protein
MNKIALFGFGLVLIAGCGSRVSELDEEPAPRDAPLTESPLKSFAVCADIPPDNELRTVRRRCAVVCGGGLVGNPLNPLLSQEELLRVRASVIAPCEVTSDTGSCSASALDATNPGLCCVCLP